MCARYSLTADGRLVVRIGDFDCVIHVTPRYNIAPTQTATVIAPCPGGFAGEPMRFGWSVPWNNGPLLNAQAETVQTKHTFHSRLHQRCLVPADGFYEWRQAGAARLPIRFVKPDRSRFCFAGLWDNINGQNSFLILTTTPNGAVARVHHRMPLIVPREFYDYWLDDRFEQILQYPDRAELDSFAVPTDLNKSTNEGPHLIQPVFHGIDSK